MRPQNPQNTYAQYLAAQQLKRHSWRFNKKYSTWFLRSEEPLEITADFERGSFQYFDYEQAWCPRIKRDFVFQYINLENENTG